MKAKGFITDYGVEEVEQLGGKLKAVVMFQLTEKDDGVKYETMKWDGFFVKKDGSINTSTFKNLIQMGFKSEDLSSLASEGALDLGPEYFLTIEIDEKGYQRIQWVNREESSGMKEIKKSGADSLKRKFAEMRIGGDIKKMMSENKIKDDVPNLFNADEKMPGF